jgi:hypothetical protein
MDPDPTSFFIDLKDANFFSYYVLEIAYRHIIFSLKIIFFAKIEVKLYLAGIIAVRSTHLRKRKDPDPDPVPLTNASESGRPKNMRILRIRFRIPNTGKKITNKKRNKPYLSVPLGHGVNGNRLAGFLGDNSGLA